jgi:hypothetical protein
VNPIQTARIQTGENGKRPSGTIKYAEYIDCISFLEKATFCGGVGLTLNYYLSHSLYTIVAKRTWTNDSGLAKKFLKKDSKKSTVNKSDIRPLSLYTFAGRMHLA